MSTTNRRLTAQTDKLHLQVRDAIISHAEEFREAGKYLDAEWTRESIQRREDAETREILRLGADDPLPDFFDDEAALRASWKLGLKEPVGRDEWVTVEPSKESEPFTCLYRFFIKHTGAEGEGNSLTDLSGLPEAEAISYARVILLVAWLLSDPEAHTRGLGLTRLEECGYGDDEVLSRDWARFVTLISDDDRRADWMELVESALLQVKSRRRTAQRTEDISSKMEAARQEALRLLAEWGEWIPAAELGGALPSRTTVKNDFYRVGRKRDREGSQQSGERVKYRTSYIREFIEERWTPRPSRVKAVAGATT